MTPELLAEQTQPGLLLSPLGMLCRPRWAREPILRCNLEHAGASAFHWLRLKRWDYHGVWLRGAHAAACLAHSGYAGTAFFYAVELVTGQCAETAHNVLLGRGVRWPADSTWGDASDGAGPVRAAFQLAAGVLRVEVRDPGFANGDGLRMDVALACPRSHESIVTAAVGGRCLYYNRKIVGMPAEGFVVWESRRFSCDPEPSPRLLDWGRGILPYPAPRLWACAARSLATGEVLGLNLGAGCGEALGRGNAVFLGRRLHKLGAVDLHFDPGAYHRPWGIADRGGRVRAEMLSVAERVARANFGILRSEVQ